MLKKLYYFRSKPSTLKKLLAIIFLISAFTAKAQDFPGRYVELLKGRDLRVIPMESRKKDGYYGFYKDELGRKMYKAMEHGFTKYAAVAGKTFKVISYKPAISHYMLQLDNPETGTIYFEYREDNESSFPFEVIGGIEYPEQFYIDKLFYTGGGYSSYSRSGSAGTGVATPTYNGMHVEYYRGQKHEYAAYLEMSEQSADHESEIKGVKIYLEDGKMIDIPDNLVSSTPKSGEYRYSASAFLTKDQIALLKDSKVIRFALGTHEKEVTRGAILKEFIKRIERKR